MPAFAIRKQRENNEKLLSRFKKNFFGSRISPLKRAKVRFAQKPNERKTRIAGLKRAEYRAIRSKTEILS